MLQRGARGRAGGPRSVQSPSLSPAGLSFFGRGSGGEAICPICGQLLPGLLLSARRSQKSLIPGEKGALGGGSLPVRCWGPLRDPPQMQQKTPGGTHPAPKSGAGHSSQPTALNSPLKTRYSTKRYKNDVKSKISNKIMA